MIGLALFDSVYLVDHVNNNHQHIANLNMNDPLGNKYVSSISFDRSGEALSVGVSDVTIEIYDVERG